MVNTPARGARQGRKCSALAPVRRRRQRLTSDHLAEPNPIGSARLASLPSPLADEQARCEAMRCSRGSLTRSVLCTGLVGLFSWACATPHGGTNRAPVFESSEKGSSVGRRSVPCVHSPLRSLIKRGHWVDALDQAQGTPFDAIQCPSEEERQLLLQEIRLALGECAGVRRGESCTPNEELEPLTVLAQAAALRRKKRPNEANMRELSRARPAANSTGSKRLFGPASADQHPQRAFARAKVPIFPAFLPAKRRSFSGLTRSRARAIQPSLYFRLPCLEKISAGPRNRISHAG